MLADDRVTLTERDYYERYLGFDDVGAFERSCATAAPCGSRTQIADLVARKAVRLESLERDVSVLFPGAADAVRRAWAAMPIAIASGARGDEIRRVLDREGLTACFTAIVAAEDTAASKPAPDPYLHALSRLAPPGTQRPSRANASRSRIRAGVCSRRALPACEPLP